MLIYRLTPEPFGKAMCGAFYPEFAASIGKRRRLRQRGEIFKIVVNDNVRTGLFRDLFKPIHRSARRRNCGVEVGTVRFWRASGK